MKVRLHLKVMEVGRLSETLPPRELGSFVSFEIVDPIGRELATGRMRIHVSNADAQKFAARLYDTVSVEAEVFV